jgi:type IV pilus assembly protein PilW
MSAGCTGRERVRGFSIVELMVAMTLALIVTAAVISVFVASRASYSRTTGTASLADGGRFALDYLQAAVRSAGYIVCNSANRTMTTLNAASFSTPLATNFGQSMAGYEASGTSAAGALVLAATSPTSPIGTDANTGDWLGGLDATLAGKVVKNNDVLVVYSTVPNSLPAYVSAIVDGATNFKISGTGNALCATSSSGSCSLLSGGGQLIAISDCAKSAVMWSSAALTASGTDWVVTHDTTGGENSSSTLPLSFAVGSQVAPVQAAVYYIGQGDDGDGALFMLDPNGGANHHSMPAAGTELVPDIEAMQILYGVDTTGTQTVSDYVTADQVPVIGPSGWASVISVKIAVLAASELNAMQPPAAAAPTATYNLLGTTVTAPKDSRARQVFEMTIGLRNQSQ